jgi:hypothetical protein
MACRSFISSQQEPIVVGDFEDEHQHACLGVVEIQDSAQQQRPHLTDGGPHRMSLFTEDIPEHDRITCQGPVSQTEGLHPCVELRRTLPGLRDSRQVSLYVRREYGHADGAERLCHDLQRDSFPRTGRACNQAMAISHSGQQTQLADTTFRNHRHLDHRSLSFVSLKTTRLLLQRGRF